MRERRRRRQPRALPRPAAHLAAILRRAGGCLCGHRRRVLCARQRRLPVGVLRREAAAALELVQRMQRRWERQEGHQEHAPLTSTSIAAASAFSLPRRVLTASKERLAV